MKRILIRIIIFIYSLLSIAPLISIAQEGTKTSIMRDNYVITGISSGGETQLNTVVIFDSEKKYVWWINVYSDKLKLGMPEPVWHFIDLSELEPKPH